MDDPYDLERFVRAQEPVYDQVLNELRVGRKTSHWMWFIFPQIEGLGHSPMARRYAIRSAAEAAAYAGHSILGLRLRQCTELVNAVQGRTALEIFGRPDDVKFRSSMTLFAACSSEPEIFQDALKKYFDGEVDLLTLSRLQPPASRP